MGNTQVGHSSAKMYNNHFYGDDFLFARTSSLLLSWSPSKAVLKWFLIVKWRKNEMSVIDSFCYLYILSFSVNTWVSCAQFQPQINAWAAIRWGKYARIWTSFLWTLVTKSLYCYGKNSCTGLCIVRYLLTPLTLTLCTASGETPQFLHQ